MTDITARLQKAMARIGGVDAPLEALTRLSGGANMESWSFDHGGLGFVLRRAPSPELMAGRSFGHDVEAALVQLARSQGVLAPEVVGALSPEDDLGTGYIMRRIEAEVNPATILAQPPPTLINDIAREMARVHAIKPRDDIAIPRLDPATALGELKARFLNYGGDRPIIALAIKWCEDHIPAQVEPVLVHGDFRMGNLMVDANGLAAVLDWELAHWGDSHEDLAYGCMAAWRFGHYERPAFGCADLESYFTAYESAGGGKVDVDRFRYWLVYRTLWWALGCLQMADYWRSGADNSVERVVIGRRTSENELDLLMLLEEVVPEKERAAIALPSAPPPRRVGEPSATEMLEAVRDWIDRDVKPQSTGRDKFMAAVAMNALGMLIREVGSPCDPHDKALAHALLSGDQNLATAGLLAVLRISALQKLANDSPKYASLAAARKLWLIES